MDEDQLARLQAMIENRVARGFRTFIREVKADLVCHGSGDLRCGVGTILSLSCYPSRTYPRLRRRN